MNHPTNQTPNPALGYCATCREKFATPANPPYGVIHVSPDAHLHPLTREPLTRA